ALTGSRYALHASDTFAQAVGYERRPLDDLFLFHMVFGKSVNEISLNAIANLGYAEVHFRQPCYVGDTVRTESEIIGLKENSNGKSGNVYVHSQGYNQREELILTLKRWVMVRKKDSSIRSGIKEIPVLQKALPADLPINLPVISKIEPSLSGSNLFWEDYSVGERLNHPDGITIDNSDHTLAAKLYQNNAKIHFNAHMMQKSPMRERLIYGGHIISLCRSISFNGLGNAMWLYGINAGTHANPTFAGDTIYCYSIIKELIAPKRDDVGLMKVQTIGLKNMTPEEIETPFDEHSKYHANVVLNLDYTLIVPKKQDNK
ncbi:MaoC family dehydratase, partial [Thermodesulfovibrionales bacterium]|nr:MaoC family dehydratase [Thermodesulfovibrionales bacterium]